jgi:hypothetical protein
MDRKYVDWSLVGGVWIGILAGKAIFRIQRQDGKAVLTRNKNPDRIFPTVREAKECANELARGWGYPAINFALQCA